MPYITVAAIDLGKSQGPTKVLTVSPATQQLEPYQTLTIDYDRQAVPTDFVRSTSTTVGGSIVANAYIDAKYGNSKDIIQIPRITMVIYTSVDNVSWTVRATISALINEPAKNIEVALGSNTSRYVRMRISASQFYEGDTPPSIGVRAGFLLDTNSAS